MDSNSVTSRAHAEKVLVDRAAADPAFRKQLLASPREAISDVLGMPLPGGINVTVVEETDRHIYLVLPMLAAGEMAERELAGVSGGTIQANQARIPGGADDQGKLGPATPGMADPPDPGKVNTIGGGL